MCLIDTHTHLATETYLDNLSDVLDRSRRAGVDQWISIGTTLDDSKVGIKLSRRTEGMFSTVGVHPHEAGKQSTEFSSELENLAGEENVCAIGEIGLDYHYDFCSRVGQQRVFRDQLDVAGKTGKPVVIHCREAVSDCLAVLDEWNHPDSRVVFHCFTGTLSEARMILDRNMWLSFTGTITFRKSEENRQVAKYVPLDRVMLETDCPYLSPEPKRKVRMNEPAFLVHTAQRFAELRKMSFQEIAEITTVNSRLFFNLTT
jgi:TatD DNase family protein